MASVKKVVISVTNDLLTDQRIQKVSSSLIKNGYSVQLVGRRLKNNTPLNLPHPSKRFKLWFNKGPWFYFNYNLRLFIFLLVNRADILIANDLDTLPANYLVSRLKKIPLVYDSHEYFTEVPELVNRPRTQAIWLRIESYILPKLKHAYTVSSRIAKNYNEKYGLRMSVVRNFPKRMKLEKNINGESYDFIYQGALNIGRGIEELIEAMTFLQNRSLVIVGSGDIELRLRALVKDSELEQRVTFKGRLKPEELANCTKKARIGVSLEKQLGLSYQFALPNKIFDYIHAGIPILYSPLVEVVETLDGYKVGRELVNHEPESIARQLELMLTSEDYELWERECRRAAEEFNWEREEEKLLKLIGKIEPN